MALTPIKFQKKQKKTKKNSHPTTYLQKHMIPIDTTPIKSIKELELDTNPIVDLIVDDMHINSAVSQPFDV